MTSNRVLTHPLPQSQPTSFVPPTTTSSSSLGAGSGLSATRTNSITASTLYVNKPSLIEYGRYRFLIMDAPTDANLSAYIDILKKKKVVAVVRACEPTYAKQPLEEAGMKVTELNFPDGDPPPAWVLAEWLKLVHTVFESDGSTGTVPHTSSSSSSSSHGPSASSTPNHPNAVGSSSSSSSLSSLPSSSPSPFPSSADKRTIAVHCVAGLGRAPVLVTIALIELGMERFDAIALIRKKRRGALNSRQLKFIESYKPKKQKQDKCIIA